MVERIIAGGLGFATARRIALALPGVVEGIAYSTPAFRVADKIVARLKEDGVTLAVKVSFEEREILIAMEPEIYFLTDHYRPHPMMLVALERIGAAALQSVLEQAWRQVAPKKLLKAGL